MSDESEYDAATDPRWIRIGAGTAGVPNLALTAGAHTLTDTNPVTPATRLWTWEAFPGRLSAGPTFATPTAVSSSFTLAQDGLYAAVLTRLEIDGRRTITKIALGQPDAHGLCYPPGGFDAGLLAWLGSGAAATGWAGGARGSTDVLLEEYDRTTRDIANAASGASGVSTATPSTLALRDGSAGIAFGRVTATHVDVGTSPASAGDIRLPQDFAIYTKDATATSVPILEQSAGVITLGYPAGTGDGPSSIRLQIGDNAIDGDLSVYDGDGNLLLYLNTTGLLQFSHGFDTIIQPSGIPGVGTGIGLGITIKGGGGQAQSGVNNNNNGGPLTLDSGDPAGGGSGAPGVGGKILFKIGGAQQFYLDVNSLRWSAGITPTIDSAQSLSGAGRQTTYRGQKGATGTAGGNFLIAGGEAGTPGSAGPTGVNGGVTVDLGTVVSHLSASFLLTGSEGAILDIHQNTVAGACYLVSPNSMVATATAGSVFLTAGSGLVNITASSDLFLNPASKIKFFGSSGGAVKQTVSGVKLPSDTVLASLLAALVAYGLITDTST